MTICTFIPVHKLTPLVLSCLKHNVEFLRQYNLSTICVLNGPAVQNHEEVKALGFTDVWISPRQGRSDARNMAVNANEKFKYLLFLDCDVKMKKFDIFNLLEDSKAELVQGIVFPKTMKKSRTNNLKMRIYRQYQLDSMFGYNRTGLDTCCLLIDAKLFKDTLFDTEFIRCEDMEILFRMLEKGERTVFLSSSFQVEKYLDINLFNLVKYQILDSYFIEKLRKKYTDKKILNFFMKNELQTLRDPNKKDLFEIILIFSKIVGLFVISILSSLKRDTKMKIILHDLIIVFGKKTNKFKF